MSKIIFQGEFLQNTSSNASNFSYDNSKSGISATNTQDALLEVISQLCDLKKALTAKVIYRENKLATYAADGYVQWVKKSDLNIDDSINLTDYIWFLTPINGDNSDYHEWDHFCSKCVPYESNLSCRTWMFAKQSSSSAGNKVKLVKNMSIYYNILGIKKA